MSTLTSSIVQPVPATTTRSFSTSSVSPVEQFTSPPFRQMSTTYILPPIPSSSGPASSSSPSLASGGAYQSAYPAMSSTVIDGPLATDYLAGNGTQASTGETIAPPASPPLPVIVGAVVTSIILLVAVVVGWIWIRRRRGKGERQDARHMRELGRERGGAWLFERGVAPRMQRLGSDAGSPMSPAPTYISRADARLPHALPSAYRPVSGASASASMSEWADDSELDMMATDGSSLARTLSTRSALSTASTIRTLASPTDRERIDHPGYTYRSATSASRSRSTPTTTPGSTLVSGSPFSPFGYTTATTSPFADPSPTHTLVSPVTPVPRSPFRLSTSTISSENPFVDPLPAYSADLVDFDFEVNRVAAGGGRHQLARIDTGLQRPPPAYRELQRGER